MGRIAGVTAEETRERVLASAASVFGRLGYDGASIAEIAADAGVTGGAIYAHFPSKAELFVAALHEHGSREVERLLQVDGPDLPPDQPTDGTVRMIQGLGLALIGDRDQQSSLIVEAIVAAKRHPDVAALLVGEFSAREAGLTGLLQTAQRTGAVDDKVRINAVARFLVMLSLGSLLVRAMDLPPVDEDDWTVLITDLVGRFNPRPRPT